MARFLVPPDQISHQRFTLTGSEAHHAIHVLRKKVGDEIDLFDGRDHSYTGRILFIGEEEMRGEILSRVPETRLGLSVILCQGLLKGPKWDWLIEKAAELGVQRLVPLLTARTIVKWNNSDGLEKWKRWQRIALAASKQCGRSDVMEIEKPIVASEVWQKRPRQAVALMPWEKETGATVAEALKSIDAHEVFLYVGPEGGWEASEVDAAKRAGIQTVRLGPTLLRSETAGLVAATLTFASRGIY